MTSSDNARNADNQQVIRQETISDEYFAGFVDGEGCFYVGFSRRKDLPLNWQIITEFHLSQNPGGKNILEAFRDRIGCGYIKPNHPNNPKDRIWVLVVKDRSDIKERLLPFFSSHPLHSQKAFDLNVFRQTLGMIERKEHLRRNGFRKIVKLVFKTNRKTAKRYSQEILLNI